MIEICGNRGLTIPSTGDPVFMNDTPDATVKVYDFQTKTFTSMPAAELSSDMVQATINGEKCWINPAHAPNALHQSTFRHPPFDQPTRGRIRKLMGILKEVQPLTFAEWENGFRRDQNPQKEIDLCLHIAGVYEEVADRHALSLEQKKELHRTLSRCSTCSYEQAANIVFPEKLSREVMNEAIQAYYGEPELKKAAAFKPAIEYPDPTGNIPLPVELLRDEVERERLKEAEIIVGVDSFSGDSVVLYGTKLLKQIVARGEALTVPMVSFLFDSRTDQLGLLVRAVIFAKGSSDYPAEDEE